MLAKLFYSVLLIAIVCGAGLEFWKVWWDPKLYIGRFELRSSDSASPPDGKVFASQVASFHAALLDQLKSYGGPAKGRFTDPTYDVSEEAAVGLVDDSLATLSLSYQNVNIGELLTAFRRTVVRPNAINGDVTLTTGYVKVDIDWPRSLHAPEKSLQSLRYSTEPRASQADAARLVACGIVWRQISEKAATVKALPPELYCQWAEALSVYMGLKTKAAGLASLSDADRATAQQIHAKLTELITTNPEFLEPLRLRADVVDLLPPEAQLKSLPQAQLDRVSYAAAKDPSLKDLPPDTRRIAIAARARPSLLIRNGQIEGLLDNWSLLKPYGEQIRKTTAATGFLTTGVGPNPTHRTAFAIADNAVMTYVADGLPATLTHFCASDDTTQPCPAGKLYKVKKTVLFPGKDEPRPAILFIETTDGDDLAPLKLSAPATDAATLLDRYIYVLGYPVPDQRAPLALNQKLLGDQPGQKRLMPGRTVSLGDSKVDASLGDSGPLPLRSDAATLNGAGGGPVLDLLTGQVVGVHYAGRWDPNGTKFAYCYPITAAVAEWAQETLHPPPPKRRAVTKPTKDLATPRRATKKKTAT